MNYENKYLKYKKKYLMLKNQKGGIFKITDIFGPKSNPIIDRIKFYGYKYNEDGTPQVNRGDLVLEYQREDENGRPIDDGKLNYIKYDKIDDLFPKGGSDFFNDHEPSLNDLKKFVDENKSYLKKDSRWTYGLNKYLADIDKWFNETKKSYILDERIGPDEKLTYSFLEQAIKKEKEKDIESTNTTEYDNINDGYKEFNSLKTLLKLYYELKYEEAITPGGVLYKEAEEDFENNQNK